MSADLESWFAELDGQLTDSRHWWQLRPFHCLDLPWRDAAPELVVALEALDTQQLQALQTDPQRLCDWLSPWLPQAQRLTELARLSQLPQRSLELPPRLEVGVPGRKWQQILKFAAARPASSAPLLEWCAGKGYLGRVLATVDHCPVTSLEWQSQLCSDGQQFADDSDLPQHFVCVDALAAEAGVHLPPQGQTVALHACGDLHLALLRHWADSDCRQLDLSPCCYHLTRDEAYRPLSAAARTSLLRLDRHDLSLPLQETVTAGARERRQRQQDLHWRLAFDEWQRSVRGVEDYLPVPALPRRTLSGRFEDYCRAIMAHHRLAWPGLEDEAHWLARGAERVTLVERMELVRQIFRRPLEIWLLLDRALFLQERGAEVRLGEFCERQLTPRNILLHASRAD